MSHTIKYLPTLRTLLWLDALIGGSTGIGGLIFFNRLPDFLGLNPAFILCVSCITLCYALVAFYLARQRVIAIPLLRLLIAGNWAWTVISIALLFLHFGEATVFGKTFLILQVLIVGGLAYFEEKQLRVAAA
ncbi:MAG TPA: hypothetical protein VHM26_12325 [Chitinophagaceae bacterium]|jgi:hypothetical protein|nr:hypothetical protein [Chitinophagaceae bacterium]